MVVSAALPLLVLPILLAPALPARFFTAAAATAGALLADLIAEGVEQAPQPPPLERE